MRDECSSMTCDDIRQGLARPVGVDFHPLVSKVSVCSKCGAKRADYWVVINGVRTCNDCASGYDPHESALSAVSNAFKVCG